LVGRVLSLELCPQLGEVFANGGDMDAELVCVVGPQV